MTRTERNNLDIAADILKLAKDGVRKTHVQYGANLSWDLTKQYLSNMVSGGLLVIEGKHYKPTEKGSQWLWYYDLLMGKTPAELTR